MPTHQAVWPRESNPLYSLMDKNLDVHVLTQDAELRGIDVTATGQSITNGDYDSLMDLLESSDWVMGLL